MAWLRVGQASWVFWCLGVVIAVAAPGLLGHLPSISDLGIKIVGSCIFWGLQYEAPSNHRLDSLTL